MKTIRLKYYQIISILALSAGMLFSCSNTVEEVAAVTFDESYPAETTRDAHITYSDSGYLRLRIDAPLIEHYNSGTRYSEFPEGVEVVFLNSLGERDSFLKADYAIFHTEKNLMEARTNVVAINDQGDRLETEHLEWNEKTKTLHSNAFVKIQTKDEIIYGDGLDANEDFTRFEIKNIKGIINIEDETLQ